MQACVTISGEVIMVVPIPPSGVGSGWEDIGDGNMAQRPTRFLQRDIDEGRIWYRNKGNIALTDILRFEVMWNQFQLHFFEIKCVLGLFFNYENEKCMACKERL